MSIFRYGPDNKAKVVLTRTPSGPELGKKRQEYVTINGKKLGEAQYGKYLAELLKIDARVLQTIPAELIDQIDKDLRGGTGQVPATVAVGERNLKRLAAEVARPVTRMQLATFNYYRASLRSLEEALHDPQVPPRFVGSYYNSTADTDYEGFITPFNKTFTLNLGGSKTDTVRISGGFSALHPYTLWEKDQMMTTNPTYWKHTGRGYAAFKAQTRSRLSSLRLQDFTKVTSPQSRQLVSTFRKNLGGYRREFGRVQYKVEIGIPPWNSKMDMLFTVPFATGKMLPLKSSLGLSFDKAIEREDGGFSNTILHGLDRILAAEMRRPWLRELAFEGGNALRRYLGLPALMQTGMPPPTKKPPKRKPKPAQRSKEKQMEVPEALSTIGKASKVAGKKPTQAQSITALLTRQLKQQEKLKRQNERNKRKRARDAAYARKVSQFAADKFYNLSTKTALGSKWDDSQRKEAKSKLVSATRKETNRRKKRRFDLIASIVKNSQQD